MALEHDDLERGALLASPTASPKPVQPAPATPDRSVAWRVFWTLAFYAPSAALPLAARLLVVYREDAVMSLASLLKSAAFGCMQDAAVFLQTLVVARLVLYFRDLLTCSRNVYRSVLVHFVAAFALAFAYMWMTLACVVDLSLLLQFLPRLNRGFVKMYIHFSAQFASSINDVISVQMVAGFSLYVLSMVLWVVSVLFDKAHLPQFGIVFCQTGRSVSTPLAAATSTEPSQVKSQGKAPRRPSVSVSNAGLFPCFIHLVTTSLTLRTLVIALMTSVSALHATLALDGNGSDIYLMSNAMFSLEMDDFLKPSASSDSGTHALDSKTLPHMRDFAAIVDRLIGPNEVFLVADKNGHYPLWRKTVGYKGEKRFNVKKSKTPPTVLLFNIESFRAREVGVIGGREKKALYNQTVTPFFDELSRSGVLFRQHYTPSIQTSRTMMSTLFGVLPSLTDATAVAKFGERKTRLHGITHILKKFANYKTMFWSAVDLRWEDWKGFFRANGFDQLVGETEVLDHLTPERRKSLTDAERFSWGRHDPVSFDALENFLEQRQKDESASKQPLFMDIYSITSHVITSRRGRETSNAWTQWHSASSLNMAGGQDKAQVSTQDGVAPTQMQVDIAIVGAGLAGLSASIEAATLAPTAKIVVIEREAKVGGNSAKASSGINAAISADDEPVFEKDTLKSGGGLSNEDLVDFFVKNSPSAIDFLKQSEVDLSVLCQLGGHSAKRTHRNKSGPNVGFAIINALQKKMGQLPNVLLINGATAEKFLTSGTDGINGLQVRKADREVVDIHSGAVILATGGFSSNHKLLKRFAPGMESFPTTNGPCAQGDGVVMAEALGADLVLMDKVQLHPTGFINPKDRDAQQKFLAPEAIRGSGALLINTAGKRFINELSTRDVVSQAILAQPGKIAFMWLFEGAKALESSLGFYKHIGLVKQVGSVREAAEYCHLDAETVLSELNEYAAACASQHDERFGKEYFPYPLKKIETVDASVDIHVMEIAPAVHYCMGGVKINQQTEVLRKDGAPIRGLFAAGEVSGGLHGANRLGGNSLAECVVFGRVAGQQAVRQVLQARA